MSRLAYLENETATADCLYYLNKSLHSIELFYEVALPEHFMVEHPLGSVIGKAKYGDYFCFYQGCTIGGNYNNGVLKYPTIGNNVRMYANSTIIGDSKIGDNVIISANTYIKNQVIPDNSIVFGSSPDNLVIIRKEKDDIFKMFQDVWIIK